MAGNDRGLLARLRLERILPEEWFCGFSIELLSRLAAIARAAEPPLPSLYSDYESLYKQLFQQPSPRDTIDWLQGLAGRIIEGLQERRHECIPLAVGYADADYFCSVFRKLTGRHPSKVEPASEGGS